MSEKRFREMAKEWLSTYGGLSETSLTYAVNDFAEMVRAAYNTNNRSAASCTWTEDDEGNWHTKCGQAHQFINGTPKENHYGFCPYCGKEICEGGDP